MSVETLQIGSLVCLIVAGVFVVVAIVLFFVLDVPALVGELTGATERKAIENIRLQNEDNPDGVQSRQKKAKGVPKVMNPKPQREVDGGPGTAKLSITKLQLDSDATTVLNAGDNVTMVLGGTENVTTVLNYGGNETTVLRESANETTAFTQPVEEFSIQVAFEYASSLEVIE